jgi:hypothetical protein
MPAKAGIALHAAARALVGARLRAMLLLGTSTLQSKSFRLPAAAELLSLCVAKEKDNQRERPPRLALVGHPAQQFREPAPGFSTAHPCAGEKASASLPMPASRPVDPDSPPHRGPGRAAGHPGPHFSEKPGAKPQQRADCYVPSRGQELQSQLLIDRLLPQLPVAQFLELPRPVLPRYD